VATVARAHELNANVVFHWRKLYRAGVLSCEAGRRDEPRLLPVTVSGAGCGEPSDSAAASSIFQSATPGSIEITFQKAQVRCYRYPKNGSSAYLVILLKVGRVGVYGK